MSQELLGKVVSLIRGKSTVASPVKCGLWEGKKQENSCKISKISFKFKELIHKIE